MLEPVGVTTKSLTKELDIKDNSESSIFRSVLGSVNKYIVSPANAVGILGFVFDIEGEIQHKLESEITDNWVEDNSPIQDHIALKPETIMFKNYVGELKYTDENDVLRTAAKVLQKLTTITQYAQTSVTSAQQLYSVLKGQKDFRDSLNAVTDLWSLVKNLNPFATAQQQAFVYFKALWEQKAVVSLTTPFGFVKNMAIASVMASQPEETNSYSAFTITLKKIRVSSTRTVLFDKSKYQDRTGTQSEPAIKKNQTNGISVGKQLLDSTIEDFKG